MKRVESFVELRPLLFSIAYRILGSVSDAEDIVQDAWLRYDSTDAHVTSPKAFLSTIVTRLSINELKSARSRREKYIGEWFPEPLLEDPYKDPERQAELADSVSVVALVLLERLSPLERAVFVLKEVFGFSMAEIAVMIDRSESACRQLAVRARKHMDEGLPRFETDRHEQETLAKHFLAALNEGNVDGLRLLLAADVQVSHDSGGKAPSLPRIVVGADNVSRLLTTAWPRLSQVGLNLEMCEINGQLGVLVRDRAGAVVSATMLDIADGLIRTVRILVNPDKLAHLGPLADTWAVRDAYRTTRGE